MSLNAADENEDDPREKEENLVKNKVSSLSEHFDTVQIFVTKKLEDGKTAGFAWGSGNYFARFGQVKTWTIKEENSYQDE